MNISRSSFVVGFAAYCLLTPQALCVTRTQIERVENDLSNVSFAASIYFEHRGVCPRAIEDLTTESKTALVHNGISFSQYLDPSAAKDPWGKEYLLKIQSNEIQGVYSTGNDGLTETTGDDLDDINTWNPDHPWRAYYLRLKQSRLYLARGIIFTL